MTAKEMFEKLGFKETAISIDKIEYIYDTFDEGEIFVTFYDFQYTSNSWVDKELHQAITQQMKELGWL